MDRNLALDWTQGEEKVVTETGSFEAPATNDGREQQPLDHGLALLGIKPSSQCKRFFPLLKPAMYSMLGYRCAWAVFVAGGRTATSNSAAVRRSRVTWLFGCESIIMPR